MRVRKETDREKDGERHIQRVRDRETYILPEIEMERNRGSVQGQRSKAREGPGRQKLFAGRAEQY